MKTLNVCVSNMIQIIPLYVFIRWSWILIIITALVAFVGTSMASTMNSFTTVRLLFVHYDLVHLIDLVHMCRPKIIWYFVLVCICVWHLILQITFRSQNPPHWVWQWTESPSTKRWVWGPLRGGRAGAGRPGPRIPGTRRPGGWGPLQGICMFTKISWSIVST